MLNKITIDGKEYQTDQLSENARNQLGSLQVCDQKVSQLEVDLAIVKTARAAYARALQGELPEAEPTESDTQLTQQ